MTGHDHFTGKDLMDLGFKPGPRFGAVLKELNATLEANRSSAEEDRDAALAAVIERRKAEIAAEEAERKARMAPMLREDQAAEVIYNIEAESGDAAENLAAVREAMESLKFTPTVVAAAVMPDACPGGAIPVGGVAGAKDAIHPGWHSDDICCSMFATNFGKAQPKAVLDAAHGATHFGPGGHSVKPPMPRHLAEAIRGGNPFFAERTIREAAEWQLMSQGDGNHFCFVGQSESTGDTWLVTHHGSRGFGSRLYRAGMQVAERWRRKICPDLDKGNAWIPFDTDDGRDYWDALQVVREWTKQNHGMIHAAVESATGASIRHQRWNEHNFVFRDGDVFWHGKGATPIHDEFMPDTDGIQIVPLNMSEPILFVRGERHEGNLGFAPHGAGRHMSRTKHKKRMAGESDEAIFARETAGLDVRMWCGKIDITELPSAYKDADVVQEQMRRFRLADVVDRIRPYGTIMAGDWSDGKPWRKKRKSKRRRRD